MKLGRLLAAALLCTGHSLVLCAADGGAEQGVLLRATELYAEPNAASTVLVQLGGGSTLEVFGRQRMWMRVEHAGNGTPLRGWVRLTTLRLTGVSSRANPAESSFGGGFARLSRSVGGLLGGFRSRHAQPARVATIGVRGLTPGELKSAPFDAAAWAAVAAAAAAPADAELFAQAGGLRARSISDNAALAAAASVQP